MATEGERVREGIVNIIKNYDSKPCPSNTTMADLLGSDPRRISEFLHLLIKDGVLEKHGAQLRRAFSVVETGERTLPRFAEPKKQLPKHCNEELARTVSINAKPLPVNVWYGGRDRDGHPIR